MSEARKCDRCHEFYELPKEQQNKNAPYDIKGTYVKFLFCDNNRDYPETVRWYDLCPKCVELLDKWLEIPDCADRSNGATEKELELASKLNDAKIYIAQLKSELGFYVDERRNRIHERCSQMVENHKEEAAKFVETKSLNEYGCPHDKCCDCPHFSKEPNPFNVHDHNGIYKCNDKNIYISGNCSRPDVSDMTPKDFCNLGCNFVKETIDEPEYKDPCKSCHSGIRHQCDYGYCSEEDKKKRWLGNHKEENKNDQQ